MNEIQRRARIRKGIYLGGILALFTLSLIWRGVIPIPFASALAAKRETMPQLAAAAERAQALPVLAQANKLELRELDMGDPNIATSAAQYALLGLRGPMVTGLWWAAMEKQKRNEWHEFEQLVRLVTHLQPNFITPWIFQSWNIAYNVSVENDKLGDMYFYIARGIELLAEGDRLNTKIYRGSGNEELKVGSPDIRYQIGFYYQNKFGVSDKVNTLRSLMQLSCIKPNEREADSFLRDGEVNMDEFRKFCKANPQLVRRLRTKLNCVSPKDVIDFLRANAAVPSRYEKNGALLPDDAQFPILPAAFPPRSTSVELYNPRSETTDTFDAFHAALAWFEYAQILIPPPPEGEPAASPRRGEYDEFRFRLPQKPALVIFRMSPPRSQTYLAERLTKEGWFTKETEWNPDEGTDSPWFPTDFTSRTQTDFEPLRLKTPTSAQKEWGTAYQMWREYGNANGLMEEKLTKYLQLSPLATMFTPGQLPPPPDEFTDEALDSMFAKTDPSMSVEDHRKRCRDIIRARRALVLYGQNVQVTNYPYFLVMSQAEMSDELIRARRLQYDADVALRRGAADRKKALNLQIESIVQWREAMQKFSAQFHQNDAIQEQMYEAFNGIVSALKQDAVFNRKVENTKLALSVFVPEPLIQDLKQPLAENEALVRVANASRNNRFAEKSQSLADAMSAVVGGWSAPQLDDPEAISTIRRSLLQGEFSWMKQYMTELRDVYWIKPNVQDSVKQRLGITKPPPPPPEVSRAGEPQPGP